RLGSLYFNQILFFQTLSILTLSNNSCILLNVAAAFRDVNHVSNGPFHAALMAALTHISLNIILFLLSADDS
ncbi:hypothetical protein, partial [Pantoea sp. R102]|uniref:hypothetical protein n=1 Tax=Pantoea sp. R102 TaxID=2507583 RepID=UPI001B3C98FB